MSKKRQRFAVTYGVDGRPKLHRVDCGDVAKYELRTGRAAWQIDAANLRDAMWQAGQEQRQVNDDPNDMDEDPGVDPMSCIRVEVSR